LIGYTVDGRKAKIMFNVLWPYKTLTDVKEATIVFSGVAGYFFENDLGSNILYSIEECPLDEFLREQSHMFEEGRKWGWPKFLKATAEETLSRLVENGLKCFEISSSYGLRGWVVASEVESSECMA
jgi:hypothetical protein